MNRKFKKIYTYVALTLLGVGEATLQAQNYGALQYMLQKRPASEKFERNKSNEHLFFTAGVGVQSLLTQKESQDAVGMLSNLFVGKWFTPVHALRAGLGLGYLPSQDYGSKVKTAQLSLDYLLNMSSLAFGYNDNRRFEMFGVFGIDAGYSKVNYRVDGAETPLSLKKKGLFYGAHMGLQANFRLSRTLDFFIEPKIGWYNERFAGAETPLSLKKKGLFYGAHMGLQANFRLSRTLDFFIEPKIGWYNERFAYAEMRTWGCRLISVFPARWTFSLNLKSVGTMNGLPMPRIGETIR